MKEWKKEERDGIEATIAKRQAPPGPHAFLVCAPIPRDQLLWSGDTNYTLAYILVASISLFHTSQELTTAPSHSCRPRLLDTVVLIIGAALFLAVFNRIVIGIDCDPCWFCNHNQNSAVSKSGHLCHVTSFCTSFGLLIIIYYFSNSVSFVGHECVNRKKAFKVSSTLQSFLYCSSNQCNLTMQFILMNHFF